MVGHSGLWLVRVSCGRSWWHVVRCDGLLWVRMGNKGSEMLMVGQSGLLLVRVRCGGSGWAEVG